MRLCRIHSILVLFAAGCSGAGEAPSDPSGGKAQGNFTAAHFDAGLGCDPVNGGECGEWGFCGDDYKCQVCPSGMVNLDQQGGTCETAGCAIDEPALSSCGGSDKFCDVTTRVCTLCPVGQYNTNGDPADGCEASCGPNSCRGCCLHERCIDVEDQIPGVQGVNGEVCRL